jgi:hypothetical protein
MRKFNTILLIIFSHLVSEAQVNKSSNLDLIQGIWENTMNSDTLNSYKIIKGINSLGISFTRDSNKFVFYFLESLEGFQNYRSDEADSISVSSLNKNGKYFTTIINKKNIKNKWVKMLYCIVPDYFECNGENMSINGGQLVEFSKIDRLPNSALKLLYYRGKQDKKDYIKEYLDIKVVEIISQKATIFSAPEMPTSLQLIRYDVVVVIEEKGKWLKVDYGTNNLGWIKREDIE